MPRIEIPVSDHHHSLFHAAKRIVRLQVSSEEGKESRRLVLTSLIKVKFHVVFVFQIHQEPHIKQGKNFGNLAAVKNKKALWFEACAFKLRL